MLTRGLIFPAVKYLLSLYLEKEYDTLLIHKFPRNNNIIIFHTALGEELLFRIFPDLILGNEYFYTKMVISLIIFPLLHMLPLFSRKDNESIRSVVITVVDTFYMSLILSLVESSTSSKIFWYVICCVIHAGNNILYFRNVNDGILYNKGNNGFVYKIISK